jgi:hypothetical protein
VDTHLPWQVQLKGGNGKLGPLSYSEAAVRSLAARRMTTSLPRPVLIALVGAVAIVGLFVMTRRGANEATAPAPTPSAPATGTGSAPKTGAAEPSKPDSTGSSSRPDAARSSRGSSDKRRDRPAGRSRRPSTTQRRTLPPAVDKALDARKVVVLLFWNPKGSDDRSVKQAVDGLPKRGGKVAVFTDSLDDIARYARVTIPTNVRQTPTLVVVDRNGRAQVATGYHDAASIEQYVVDALRGR